MKFESNIKFLLFCEDLPAGTQLQEVPPYQNFNEGYGDQFEKDEDGKYFNIEKGSRIKMFNEAYYFLRKVQAGYGVATDCRLLVRIKDDNKLTEDWKTVSNLGVDLANLSFNDEKKEVSFDTSKSGLLDILEKRWSDDYDLQRETTLDGEALPALPTVTVQLEPREIYRESKLVAEPGEVLDYGSVGGDTTTGRAIPLTFIYNSDQENIVNTYSTQLSAAGGNYANLTDDKIGSIFYLIADRPRTFRIQGTVTIRLTGATGVGSIDLDVIRYSGGEDFNFAGVVQNYGSINIATPGATLTANIDLEVAVAEGDSLSIATLGDVSVDTNVTVDLAEILIKENDLFPSTTARFIRPYDAFNRLIHIITGKADRFTSEIFGDGGEYENYLIAHGTWVRNMPVVIAEGEENERRIQASLSLESLYEAFDCVAEPLAYDVVSSGSIEKLRVRKETDTLKSNTGIKIGRTTNGEFNLLEVQDVERDVLGENFYGSIKIGSTKSGEAYEEVNNLFSVCGNAEWNTVNKNQKPVYQRITEFRTGAEDIEIIRQIQYEIYPDLDTAYDDDWFVLDAKKVGQLYEQKFWAEYYSTIPTGIFSAETNYNWPFTPARLLLKHSWKIKPAVDFPAYINESVKFINSNCSSSLVTQVTGEDPLVEDGNIPHSRLKKAKYSLMMIKFKQPINQEIYDQLIQSEKRDSLVQFKTTFGSEYGYLVYCDTKSSGSWELIEAKLT